MIEAVVGYADLLEIEIVRHARILQNGIFAVGIGRMGMIISS